MALIVNMIGANTLSRELKRAAKDMGGLDKRVALAGKAFLAFGAVAAAAIVGVGLKLSIDLEKGLREVGTLMGGLSKGEMKDMSDELKNISIQSGQALDKLVKAKYDIVSAGFADAASSAELLRASAQLAVGGVTEISTAADLLTTTINAYNLSSRDAVDVNDKLFTIVRLGKTTIDELGGSMGRVVAIAGQTGVSLDEVGAAVATLTSQGLDTARAITSLQGAIVQIIKPTDIMQGVISRLGFATGEALLKSEGFAGSLNLIQKESERVGRPLSEVFGSIEALQAVLPLTGTAAGSFADNLAQMGDSAGAAAEAVAEMEKSTSFQLGRLKQAFLGIATIIGDKLNPVIKKAADIILAVIAPEVPKRFEEAETAAFLMALSLGELATRAEKLIDRNTELTKKIENFSKAQRQGAVINEQGKIALAGFNDELDENELKITATGRRMEQLNVLSRKYAGILFTQVGPSLEQLAFQTSVQIRLATDLAEVNRKLILTEIQRAQESISIAQQASSQIVKLASSMATMKSQKIQSGLDKDIAAEKKAFEEKKADIISHNTIQGELTEEGLEKFRELEEAHLIKINILRDDARRKSEKSKKALKGPLIAETIANTAAGAIKAFVDPGGVAGAVLAGLIVVSGLAAVATIANQSFQHGGISTRPQYLQSGGFARGTDTVPTVLSPGEIISTAQASNIFGAEIAQMNQLATGGGGAGGGGDINITIQALDGASVRRLLIDNPIALSDALRSATDSRTLTARDLPSG